MVITAGMGTRFLARTAGVTARSWRLGRLSMQASDLLGRVKPRTRGAALRLAAERAGVDTYQELMLSHVQQTHSSKLPGDFIGANYFAFGFHFAFVTGLLFPSFLEKAMENPGAFYLKEVSSSAGIAAALTFMMIAGHMGTTAIRAYKTNNLSQHIEAKWKDRLQTSLGSRLRFGLSYLTIPFGKFPGVVRDGMTYDIEGESPLVVSAAGPRLWDRTVSRVAWAVSLPLVTLAILATSGEAPAAMEWVRGLVETPLFEWATRTVVPLAVISTLGKIFSGSGANKTFVVNRDIGERREVRLEREFDLTDFKEQLNKGGE